MSYFEELKVWQKAVDPAVKVYEITKNYLPPLDIHLGFQVFNFYISFSEVSICEIVQPFLLSCSLDFSRNGLIYIST
jgi:hypothetical protein